ncbi:MULTISPECIES: hypothetical protein [unclassified Roseateles]|uniref:hypothetical protein n=1 Tax=unclassified Roseateles TaxID=2626991 RepID=UPI0006FE272C|nr:MULTISPECIES: hypothetical protein [unclassified Roseateles]KQW52056.1 hypothetical protein ASC81_05525 [Pelomonas sp. Root405]KRA78290.1 hypothetical protein ASD88_05530 [Pelomonas sp. Root662]
MDLLLKALATAAVVAGLLVLLRRAGPRFGGLAAALPLTSAPALFWLGVEQGAPFAAEAATSALLCTALTPLLVLVYGRLSLRHGPWRCLAAGLAAGALGVLGLQPWLGGSVMGGLVLAATLSVIAVRLMPKPAATAPRPGRWHRELLLTAGVSALLTALIGPLVQMGGPSHCGLLAALPVVGMSTLHGLHGRQGAAVACRFLGGYLDGTAAKAVFLAVLAAALLALPAATAWALALGAALFTLVLLRQPPLRRRSAALTT